MRRSRQAWLFFRRYGLTRTLRTLTRRYIWRRDEWVVVKSTLAGPPAEDHVGDITFRLVTPADLAGLESLDSYRGLVFRQAAEEGDWVFVACDADRVIAARQYSRTIPADTAVTRALELRSDQLYGVDAFCSPEYRSKGIIRLLGLFAMRYLATLGYTENFGLIGSRNVPSLRMSRRKGSELVCYLSHRRILFWERIEASKSFPKELNVEAWTGLGH